MVHVCSVLGYAQNMFYRVCRTTHDREGRDAMARAWRFAILSLSAMLFQTPLGAVFSDKYHVFPL